MNREEAIKQIESEWYNIEIDSMSTIGRAVPLGMARDIINTIYDDFDSRVCENCRYLKESKCKLGIYHFEIDTDPNIFGCNKFEINQ